MLQQLYPLAGKLHLALHYELLHGGTPDREIEADPAVATRGSSEDLQMEPKAKVRTELLLRSHAGACSVATGRPTRWCL